MRRKGAYLRLGRSRVRSPGSKNPRRSFLFFGIALIALGVVLWMTGCSSMIPLTVSAGFMGATVSVSTPGWSKENVPVTKSALVDAPVLMVPPGTVAVNSNTVATVSSPGEALPPPPAVPDTKRVLDRQAVAPGVKSVPVIEAPVSSPVLAIPK
jgi:hypothetical protein